MQRREEALSYYFLLETPSFIIDARSLVKQLNKPELKGRSFSQRIFHRKLYEKLTSTGIFDGILDKVTRLDDRQEMERFLVNLKTKPW